MCEKGQKKEIQEGGCGRKSRPFKHIGVGPNERGEIYPGGVRSGISPHKKKKGRGVKEKTTSDSPTKKKSEHHAPEKKRKRT